MNKHTEDDTFNRLKRSKFEAVVADLSRDILSHPDINIEDFPFNVLAIHGWTYNDYVTELVKKVQK